MRDYDPTEHEQRQAAESERERLEALTWERRKRTCPVCSRTFDGAAWDHGNALIPATSTYAPPKGAVCPWLCGTEYASREPVRLDDYREHRRDVADFDATESRFNPYHDYPGAA